MLTSDSKDVAVPVAKPSGGLDGRQVADLLQPEEQLLRSPENDHQFVSVPYDIWQLDRAHDGRRDRDLDLCTQTSAELDAIRAAFVRAIWTMTRGVSDPARRACTDPDARQVGSLTPLSASHPSLQWAARPAKSASRQRHGHRRKYW